MKASEKKINIFLENAIDLFHKHMVESCQSADVPEVVNYMQRRCITSKDLIATHKIGYFESGQIQSPALRAFKEMESDYSDLRPYFTMYSEERKRLRKMF